MIGFHARARRDHRGRPADVARDAGYVAILTAIMMPVMIMLCAFAVDVARWYVEGEQLQKTADAAALAGVTSIPQDFTGARTAALNLAARNGFTPTGNVVIQICSSSDTYSSSGAVAAGCQTGLTASQLRVTVSNTIPNFFASIFGFKDQKVSRTGISDFNGPAPLGSPCNVFGNEPSASSAPTSIISSFANCGRNPQFWGNIHGPNVWKVQGDQFNTRRCSGVESGCASSSTNAVNTEYRPDGSFYVVRVLDPARTGPITVELYDPAFVATNSRCTDIPDMPRNNMNPYTPDANTRYRDNPDPISATVPSFCTGDTWNGGNRVTSPSSDNDDIPTVTSFGLRNPTDTLNPVKGTPITGCSRQYQGYDTPTVNQVNSSSGGYNQGLAQVFHQWTTLCTINAPVKGDYYLQVRSNVAIGGNVFTEGSNDLSVKGNGSNRFGVRVRSSDGTQVSVAGWERMPIFANANGSNTTFNLIRVLPGAAGKTINFTFFDIGDAAAATGGTMTVLKPVEPNIGSALSGCTGQGVRNGALTGCSISGIRNSAGWDGQAQTIKVPVPTDYTCNWASQGGCWFRVNVNFGAGSEVTDATTWTATIDGDPVRLVK